MKDDFRTRLFEAVFMQDAKEAVARRVIKHIVFETPYILPKWYFESDKVNDLYLKMFMHK